MIRRPPRSTRTDTLFPSTTLFRSVWAVVAPIQVGGDDRVVGEPPAPALHLEDSRELLDVGIRDRDLVRDAAQERLVRERLRIEVRSEEHTSELQSLMRISYAVFCLKKKTHKHIHVHTKYTQH